MIAALATLVVFTWAWALKLERRRVRWKAAPEQPAEGVVVQIGREAAYKVTFEGNVSKWRLA